MDSSEIDFNKATIQELMVIIIDDPMATLSDIAGAREALHKKLRALPRRRTQNKIKPAYGRSS